MLVVVVDMVILVGAVVEVVDSGVVVVVVPPLPSSVQPVVRINTTSKITGKVFGLILVTAVD